MKVRVAVFCVSALLASGLFSIRSVARTAAGYGAKILCSGVFVSGRPAADVISQELALPHPATRLIRYTVDASTGTARASFLGLFPRTALFRSTLGCTLDSDVTLDQLRTQPVPSPPAALAAEPPLPPSPLDPLLEAAFREPDPASPLRTRALVVMHRGRLLAERYAPGFHRGMRLQGWSMTKSILNALTGILVAQGKLNLYAPAPVPEWSSPSDPRHAITLDQLLRMSSGLQFNENYFDLSADAPVMLFRSFSAGAYAAARPLEAAPDSRWHYSSGTANILSRILLHTLDGNLRTYWQFPRRQLFEPVGALSATLEPGPDGAFVGSSFMYATARDWARLGQLYLDDGIANGRRILPEGWVRYSTTPTPKAPQGRYGAQIWLNAGEPSHPERRDWPHLPSDTFAFNGFEGQHVIVIPSRQTVIVRLGLSQGPRNWNPDSALAPILESLSSIQEPRLAR